MIRIRDNVDLKSLEKYGFKQECENGIYYIERVINGITAYQIYITSRSHALQIRTYVQNLTLASRIQELIFDMTNDNILEKV